MVPTLVCHACGVEAMSHCPYLLHKFVINYLFDYYQLHDREKRVEGHMMNTLDRLRELAFRL